MNLVAIWRTLPAEACRFSTGRDVIETGHRVSQDPAHSAVAVRLASEGVIRARARLAVSDMLSPRASRQSVGSPSVGTHGSSPNSALSGVMTRCAASSMGMYGLSRSLLGGGGRRVARAHGDGRLPGVRRQELGAAARREVGHQALPRSFRAGRDGSCARGLGGVGAGEQADAVGAADGLGS